LCREARDEGCVVGGTESLADGVVKEQMVRERDDVVCAAPSGSSLGEDVGAEEAGEDGACCRSFVDCRGAWDA